MQRLYARACIYAACRFSKRIFTVSHFSKKELLSFFSVENKIEVIHNRVETEKFSRIYSSEKTEDALRKYQIDFPFILFVGNVKPHKNLITLIRAFEQIEEKINPVKLVVVGKKTGFITEDNEVSRYLDHKPALRNAIHFTDEVTHEELPILYQQAELFVFPSLYEGFGYPPLEALAAGTKVLCSNAGPMPEVCGDSVVYFNPTDIEALATLIRQHLSSM
jgi:glycosyltransferase involved in cell wall biosynthesis